MAIIPDLAHPDHPTKVQQAFAQLLDMGLELRLCASTTAPQEDWISASEDFAGRTITAHHQDNPADDDVEAPRPVGVTIVGGIEPRRNPPDRRAPPTTASAPIGPHSQVVQVGTGPSCSGGVARGTPAAQSWWLPMAIGFGIGLALGMVLVLAFGRSS